MQIQLCFNQQYAVLLRFQFIFMVMYLFSSTLFAQERLEKPEGPANTAEEYEQRYQDRITKDRLHGVYIPRNLEDACQQLSKNISEESKTKIKAIPETEVATVLHDRLGRWMTNNWCFYEGSRFSHYLRSAGVTYPDDMADFTIIAYHRHLNGKPIEIKQLSISFREKRQKEYQEEVKSGKVLHEETRIRKNGLRN